MRAATIREPTRAVSPRVRQPCCVEDTVFLVSSIPTALTIFLPLFYKVPWALRRGVDGDTTSRVEPSKVSQSLHIVQLCCRKKLL